MCFLTMRFPTSFCRLKILKTYICALCALVALTVVCSLLLEGPTTTRDHGTDVPVVYIVNDSLSRLHSKHNIFYSWSSQHVGFDQMKGSDCLAAFSGVGKNKDYPPSIRRWNVSRITKDAKECDLFRQKYGMQRYPHPLQEEVEFPLAFSIVFHKDFDQVLFLLRAIYRPHNLYCLHIDKKSPAEMHEAVKAVIDCLPNVFLASKLEDVLYEGFSRLQADLTCMNDSLQHRLKWRYFINLVGQQFPLRSNLEMVRILRLFNGSNDIEGIVSTRRMIGSRYQHKHASVVDPKTKKLRLLETSIVNPPPPHNFKLVKGSAFGTFSRAFIQFLMENPKAADLIRWSQSVRSPDEYVWATLHHSKIMDIPGGYAGDVSSKPWMSTYANWGSEKCRGRFVRGVCIFSTEDLPLLLSRHEFTANKFYIRENPAALHCMDQLIYNITMSNTIRNLAFYRNLPFVASTKSV